MVSAVTSAPAPGGQAPGGGRGGPHPVPGLGAHPASSISLFGAGMAAALGSGQAARDLAPDPRRLRRLLPARLLDVRRALRRGGRLRQHRRRRPRASPSRSSCPLILGGDADALVLQAPDSTTSVGPLPRPVLLAPAHVPAHQRAHAARPGRSPCSSSCAWPPSPASSSWPRASTAWASSCTGSGRPSRSSCGGCGTADGVRWSQSTLGWIMRRGCQRFTPQRPHLVVGWPSCARLPRNS